MLANIDMSALINILFAIVLFFQIISIIDLAKQYNKRIITMPVHRFQFISSMSLCIIYYAAMHMQNAFAAQVLYCISLVCYNSVIYFFFVFAELYSNHMNYSCRRLVILFVAQALDAVSLLISIFTGHIIYVSQITVNDDKLFIYNAGRFHSIHYALSVFTVLYGLFLLLRTAYRSPRSYKSRYINIAVSVVIVVAVNMVFHFAGASMDVSGIILPFAIVVIYYYSVIRAPKQFLLQSRAILIDDMGDGILVFDFDGVLRDYNHAAEDFFKLKKDEAPEVISKWVKKVGIDTLSAAPFEREFSESEFEGDPVVHVSYFPYYEPKSPDVMLGSYVRIHDRTDEIKKHQEEIFNSTHDSLTGLLNRDAFFEIAHKFLSYKDSLDYYLVCTNVENFKLYNNLFGSDEGDLFLVETGKALERHIDSHEIIGRMEADRFCVLMPKSDFNEDDFKQAYAEALLSVRKTHYSINAYLGVYEIKSLDEPLHVMYNHTLLAAQSIKGQADKFTAFYDQSITEQILDEQTRIDEIREALYNEEFTFFIQPQIMADSGEVHGGEALVRWEHPEKGIVSPFFFIGLMEKYGMIASLDLLVWKQVCRKLQEWKQRGILDHYISVNISTKDFYYMDIYETFVKLAEEYDIERKNLKLEITESAIMLNEKEQIAVINKLRSAGFYVEMDDFGSGFSSLNMLNQMSVDVLKLDLGFLQGNADVNRSKIILTSIQSMAKKLGMVTVAEGVETEEQATFLRSIGCDIFQGYLYSKPIPVSEYEEKYIR